MTRRPPPTRRLAAPPSVTTPTALADFFRCVRTPAGWEFQVGQVTWPTPDALALAWTTFRRWTTPPTAQRLLRAQAAALRRPSWFRPCTHCGELCAAGHLHDRTTCHGCAERHLGVVY